MNHLEPDPDLESRADAALKGLPPLRAPRAIAERVMQILRTQNQGPWWRQVWWHWPLPAQVSSILLALILAGAFGSGGALLDAQVDSYTDTVTEELAPIATLWDTAKALGRALTLLCTVAGQPYLLIGFAGIGILCLLCAGLAAMILRTAAKRI